MNKSKRNILFIFEIAFILLILIGLTGCFKPNTNPPQGISKPIGLTFSWLNQNQNNELEPKTPFIWQIEIKNEGSTDVKEGSGYYSIEGIDPTMYGLTKTSGTFPSQELIPSEKDPVTHQKIPGGEEIMDIQANGYQQSLPAKIKQILKVTFCYPYKTVVLGQVCISKKINNNICNPDGDIPLSTYNSPIVVSSASQRRNLLSNKILTTVIFKINRPISGTAYSKEYSHCGLDNNNDQGYQYKEPNYEDKIKFEVTTPGHNDIKIRCNGGGVADKSSGYLILSSAQNNILSCQITSPLTSNSYTIPIKLTLEYNIKDYILRSFSIMPNNEMTQ